MTVRNSPRARSETLSEIPEEEVWSGPTTDSGSVRRDPSPSRSLPTEYRQSFRRSSGPRPRNPANGWQARNISNILPSGPEAPLQPARASRRPPPELWLARHANSQIFPVDPPPPPANATTDANNNPPPPPPIVVGGRRRTGRWPWQARAQSSSIFEPENGPPPRSSRSTSTHSQYPWQERARKSTIFEILSGQEAEPKRKNRRTYDWDQRQSNQITEAIHREIKPPKDSATSGSCQDSRSTKGLQSWPWQERAMKSVVFRSPDKSTCPRPVNYVWDQRRSRFSIKTDPTAQFPKGSSYTDNFVQWEKVKNDKGMVRAAGKPCYKDDEETEKDERKNEFSQGGGKRKFKQKNSESKEVIALPAPPPKVTSEVPLKVAPSLTKLTSKKPSVSNIKGETCLDLVPLGYRFSNHNSNQSSGRSNRKVRF